MKFTLTMDQVLVSENHEVWHGVIDAPWYLLLGLSWLFNGEDSGYVTEADGSLYYCPDDDVALSRIDELPALNGWTIIPLHSDLSPRVEETVSDGEPFFVQYCGGYFPEALPDGARADLLPQEFHLTDPVVITHTSLDNLSWKLSRMMLGYQTGILCGTTSLGRFYLESATLTEQQAQGQLLMRH